jgi:hypothetical protein
MKLSAAMDKEHPALKQNIHLYGIGAVLLMTSEKITTALFRFVFCGFLHDMFRIILPFGNVTFSLGCKMICPALLQGRI